MQRVIHFSRALTFFLVFLSLGSCSTPPTVVSEKPSAAVKNSVVLDHKYFEVHYDPKFRLARYVKYTLTKERLKITKAKRTDRFKADPLLSQLSLIAVLPKDYTKSGYDKGHLAPSADFSFDQTANDQTFVMSNMVPQKPGLNRSAWRLLEEQVRRWACGEERVIVITGPILEENLNVLPSGVPIPRQFFKVVIDDTPPRKILAFVYNQEDKGQVMHERLVPIAELDRRLEENFSALATLEARGPAQLNDWKECNLAH